MYTQFAEQLYQYSGQKVTNFKTNFFIV